MREVIGKKDSYDDAYWCGGDCVRRDGLKSVYLCIFGLVYYVTVCLSLVLHVMFCVLKA